jgi:hypothetical protein
MSEKFDSNFRTLKLKPHEDEDEFDYRNALAEAEDLSDLFVIYEDEKFSEEVKQKIIDLKFEFIGTRWERRVSMSKEMIDDLELEGISIVKI